MAASACGASTATDDHASEPDAEDTSSPTDAGSPTTTDRGVVFLVQLGKPPEGPHITLSAAIGGKLVVDEKGCLRLEGTGDPQGHLPVWPPGYSLSTEGGEMRVFDDRGHVAARVGAEVVMGGGEIRKGESGGGYEEKRRKLGVPGKCRGPLWWVGTPVRQD